MRIVGLSASLLTGVEMGLFIFCLIVASNCSIEDLKHSIKHLTQNLPNRKHAADVFVTYFYHEKRYILIFYENLL